MSDQDAEKLSTEYYDSQLLASDYTVKNAGGYPIVPLDTRDFRPRLDLNMKVLPHAEGLPLPSYETVGSSGMDLRAAIPENQDICLNTVGSFAVIPTGIAIELPVGFEAQIRSRSGLAAKNGIAVLNSPGTIDSDYRGEIKIVLVNHSTNKFWVKRGMRIAQMVVCGPVPQAMITQVSDFSRTERGEGGFGSTGV